jgi:hypothetical protein
LWQDALVDLQEIRHAEMENTQIAEAQEIARMIVKNIDQWRVEMPEALLADVLATIHKKSLEVFTGFSQ